MSKEGRSRSSRIRTEWSRALWWRNVERSEGRQTSNHQKTHLINSKHCSKLSTDVAYIDFRKAFHTVFSNRLLDYSSHGTSGNHHRWIDSRLTQLPPLPVPCIPLTIYCMVINDLIKIILSGIVFICIRSVLEDSARRNRVIGSPTFISDGSIPSLPYSSSPHSITPWFICPFRIFSSFLQFSPSMSLYDCY